MHLTQKTFYSLMSLLIAGVLAGCQSITPHTSKHSPGGVLLVCNKGDHTLGIIDLVVGKQIATVNEDGVTGHEVVASPDGKLAFVPIFGNSGVGKPGTDGSVIRVIDVASRKIVNTVDFGRGVRPHCAVIGPKDGLLYVTTELENTITVIDPHTLKIVGTIPTGQPESHMFAISSDGKRGYVSNVGSGTVTVLDLVDRSIVAMIPLGTKAQRIAVSVDDQWVFTSDQAKPRLAVINTKSNGVERWIEMPGIGYGTGTTPDGKFLIVALIKDNKVCVIDLATMTVTRTRKWR
jgi:YVTN family beta-propeller protein